MPLAASILLFLIIFILPQLYSYYVHNKLFNYAKKCFFSEYDDAFTLNSIYIVQNHKLNEGFPEFSNLSKMEEIPKKYRLTRDEDTLAAIIIYNYKKYFFKRYFAKTLKQIKSKYYVTQNDFFLATLAEYLDYERNSIKELDDYAIVLYKMLYISCVYCEASPKLEKYLYSNHTLIWFHKENCPKVIDELIKKKINTNLSDSDLLCSIESTHNFTSEESKMLKKYKKYSEIISELQEEIRPTAYALHEVDIQIDNKVRKSLQKHEAQVNNVIDYYKEQLKNLEKSETLKKLIQRERNKISQLSTLN